MFCGEEALFISCSGLIKVDSNEPKVREADGGGLWARITRGKLPGPKERESMRSSFLKIWKR